MKVKIKTVTNQTFILDIEKTENVRCFFYVVNKDFIDRCHQTKDRRRTKVSSRGNEIGF